MTLHVGINFSARSYSIHAYARRTWFGARSEHVPVGLGPEYGLHSIKIDRVRSFDTRRSAPRAVHRAFFSRRAAVFRRAAVHFHRRKNGPSPIAHNDGMHRTNPGGTGDAASQGFKAHREARGNEQHGLQFALIEQNQGHAMGGAKVNGGHGSHPRPNVPWRIRLLWPR